MKQRNALHYRRHPVSKLTAALLALILLLPAGTTVWAGEASSTWGSASAGPSAPAPSAAATPAQSSAAKYGESGAKPKVAIIIDDFGNNMRGSEEMFKLPVKITVAVMPFLPTSVQDARRAHELGFDVLVHLPMEPRQGKPEWLGPGAVLTQMSDAEVRQRVEAALDQVPYAVGINNHMGSKVTGDERVMSIILAVCKERGLFFVDSHTNYRSIAGATARRFGLPPVENHIFLDDVHNSGHVLKQMRLVKDHALEQNYCITIGHVGIQGKETAAGIRSGVAELKESIEFVGITELVKTRWKWSPRLTLP
ncbi:divergent polysaccharide deacetylase family protein [Paenibacillus tengchongensis]|uniref:divergent polysaccharide deacetylase family protein n=1 Tax=Paenibacillus tengchongensis TaxID=2608684 RepID=UPI001FE758DF|nr:divergent polysaccharide deacetylase family protein [Paenibacillus tengchongensis]